MQGDETRALLLHLATISDIPTSVMNWLIDNEVIESIWDLTIVPIDEITTLQGEYQSNDSTQERSPWSHIVSSNMRSLIQWLTSYHCAFGGYPHPCILTKENFQSEPELLQHHWKNQGVKSAFIIPSNYHSSYQSLNQRHSNNKLLAYPKFTEHSNDWIEFERNFKSIATAQGFEHILQKAVATKPLDDTCYVLDSAFIYKALQYCCSDSKNIQILYQHALSQDGKQAYNDVQKSFRHKDPMMPIQNTGVDASPCSRINSYERWKTTKLCSSQQGLTDQYKSNTDPHCVQPSSPCVDPISVNNAFDSNNSHDADGDPSHVTAPLFAAEDIKCATLPPAKASFWLTPSSEQLLPVKAHCPIMVPTDRPPFIPFSTTATLEESPLEVMATLSNSSTCDSSTVLTNVGEMVVPDATYLNTDIAHDFNVPASTVDLETDIAYDFNVLATVDLDTDIAYDFNVPATVDLDTGIAHDFNIPATVDPFTVVLMLINCTNVHATVDPLDPVVAHALACSNAF